MNSITATIQALAGLALTATVGGVLWVVVDFATQGVIV